MNKEFNPNPILNFHKEIEDKFDRFNSWEHCFEAFADVKQNDDYLALHLGFYLASWGMYRGSSKLLQKDYKIHIGAVKIIKEYYGLRCNQQHEVNKNDINIILELVQKIRNYYEGNGVTSTDTLISKIIMGTLGCLPAFDRFFIEGVKDKEFKFISLAKKNLELLFEYTENNRKQLKNLQNQLLSNNIHYPMLKLVDMYFWQVGNDLDKGKVSQIHERAESTLHKKSINNK